MTAGLFAMNTPWLHTEGNKIKDPGGKDVILRGISWISLYVTAYRIGPRVNYFPHEDESDEQKANLKAMIDLMTSEGEDGWNARIIRMPVYPKQIDDDPGWLTLSTRERYNELITTAVDYATEKGIYVILDWHYVDDYGDKVDKTREFWDWAVPQFKDYSNVLFEIYNEPIDFEYIHDPAARSYSWSTWKNTLAQPIVDRIRGHHGAANLILVGGPAWCQRMYGANADPISAENIVYVTHIYPYHWDHPGDGLVHGDMTNYLGNLAENYPVFFSEWGFQDGGAIPCDGEDEDEYAAGMMDLLNKGGHSWTMWCFDPWWEPIAWGNWQYTDLLGSSLPNTGGYHGQFMKDFLFEKRNSDLPGNSEPSVTPEITPTHAPGVKGDVNGDNNVNIVDALLIAQFYVKIIPQGFVESQADVDCSGKIDIVDALQVARFYVKLIDTLDC
ncbi:MAG: cellulase family glycosylhydrolase [Spirochaetales bacterium]|nr:cellulase family glycosylhydrolase [Spirochaetales bacterium]